MDNMEEGKVYTKEISEEQAKLLIALKRSISLKNFLTGVHSALIALAGNLILYMATEVCLEEGSRQTVTIIGCVLIGILVMRRMGRILNERAQYFSDRVKQIIFPEA